MCALYKNTNPSNKAKKDNNINSDEESNARLDLLDIWRVNPAYRDIDLKYSQIRSVSVLVISILTFYFSYLTFNNLYLAIGITVFLIVGFMFEKLLSVYHNVSNASYEIVQVDPFEDFKICKLVEDPASILIVNKKTATNLITRIFQIEVLPENVHPTLNQFLKALSSAQLEYSYQVVQKPMINLMKNEIKDDKSSKFDSYQRVNSSDSFQTSIYFSVFYSINGILGESKKWELMETINNYSSRLKSNFSDNFHHTKITLLSGIRLINAIRILTFNQSVDLPAVKEVNLSKNGYLARLFTKMIFLLILLGYLWFVLDSLKIHPVIVIISESVVIIFCFFVWWRDILYVFTSNYLRRSNQISVINPFEDVTFHQLKSYKDVLFANNNNKLLTAVKIMNVRIAVQPMLAYPEKFFRALNSHQIPYAYSLYASPISSHIFAKECSKSLNERSLEDLKGILNVILDEPNPKVKHPEIEFSNWLQMRSGVWKTFLTITAISYKFISELDINDFFELGAELSTNATVMKDAFEDNFLKLILTDLNKHLLVSGFIGNCFKNMNFNPAGTRLNYLYFQGKNLMRFAKISGEFKKGLTTKIAAEFNTPIHLTNHAIIGQTINTEFLEEEKPLGFTFEQYKSLLITNGIAQEREFTKMKIAAELIKTQKACVIFDFSGDWSKLIRYFENTMYEDKFLHFKLGTAFIVNLSQSGIEHDKKNIDYLSLFYDAFALAYKEQKITIEALKKSIKKEENLDFNPLLLDYKYDKDFKPYVKDNRLLNLLEELRDQTIVFSEEASEFEDDINPIDFVKNDKSIIIDLSILKDLENKVFISFVILSKLIHYINNFSDYSEKMIFIPKVDAFFDANYLDSNYTAANYGKIEKFLEPLRKRGFGLIFSANQIRYLHPNFLNYFRNILSFRATDSRDIAVLKNQMNLQELQGSGYYSSKRNNTYQIDYLKNLRENEVIVKRADINQPFPGIITYDWFFKSLPLTRDKIIKYMERQGYNLKRSERKIMAQAKKTLFEKDFGLYTPFIKDIISFLKSIKTVDKVGNLYKGRLKEELLKYIQPSAIKRNYGKREIKEIRDELFELLVRHDYLVESHPKRASGSESMRSSFAVGPQYQRALKDYYDSQGSSTVTYEPVELESKPKVDTERLDPIKLRSALSKHFAPILFYGHFLIHKNMSHKKYEKALKIARELLSKFLYYVYQEYYGVNYALTSENKSIFVSMFGDVEGFPFTGDDLLQFLTSCKNIEVNDSAKITETCKNIYEMYSTIFDGFQQFLYLEEN